MAEADASQNENGATGNQNENGATGNHDEGDVFGSSFWKGWTGKWMQKNLIRYKGTKTIPQAVMPVPKSALFYKMDHKNRGIAIILNHENFMPNMKLKARAGTNVDSENLQRTLKRLGFEVQSHYDLSVEKINKVVECASQLDHSDSDCFLLACLSHGEQGILYAQDAPYKPETLWYRFTADKCPSLAGKPKLFFIQACQGDKLDGGVMLRSQVDSSPSYKIPAHADFLIAYSTIPGYYSWRNTIRGSWFMQALCEELSEHGFTLDMLTLLTFVNRKVAVDYESNVPDISIMHQQKQIPCITYMLTRVLKFSEKTESNEIK